MSEKLFSLHLKLANSIRTDLWIEVEASLACKMEKKLEEITQKQDRKLAKLLLRNDTQNEDNMELKQPKINVVNLSAMELNETTLHVLEYVLNFVVSPKNVPFK